MNTQILSTTSPAIRRFESYGEVAPGFLKSLARCNLALSTIQSYAETASDYLAWVDTSGLDLLKMTCIDVESFQIELAKGIGGRQIGPRRQHIYLSAIKALHKYLMREGRSYVDPSRHLRFPRLEHKVHRDALDREELACLLEAADERGGWERVGVRLLALSGLRATEAAELLLSQVDLEDRTLRVIGKGGRERVGFLSLCTQDAIRHFLEHERPAPAPGVAPGIVPGAEPRLLLDASGKELNRHRLRWAVRRCAKQARLTKTVTPHSLRRTLGTQLLRSGVGGINLKSVSMMLGHVKISTTAKSYTQITPDDLANAYFQAHPRSSASE